MAVTILIKKRIFMRKHRAIGFLVAMIVAGVAVLPAYSQSEAPDGWYYDKTIRSVSFDGLNKVKKDDLEGITGGFIGKKFSDEVFEDILNRTYALNLFEDIEDIRVTPYDGTYSSCRYIGIVLQVKEYPVITKIRFIGYRQVKRSELNDAISSAENSVYNESKRYMDERAIRDLYIEKGYTDIKVMSSAQEDADGYTVTFTIDEGEQTVVKSILFTGNSSVNASTLKGKISLKEVGFFQKGSFQEAQLEQDAKTITSYYNDRGYVDAKVLNYSIEESVFNEEKNRRELTIRFNIQEGSKYNFGGITFEGNKVFSTETLQSLVRLKVGDVYNETKFQETAMAIQTKYYENGYTSNQFSAAPIKDANTKTVSYVFHIKENERSHIENIIIKGNTKTKDYVIEREIPLESGDIFSNTKIMNGIRNLYNTQYFSQAYPEVQPGSEDNLIDVIIDVTEQSTTTLDFGVTFSGVADPDQFPVSLFAKWQDSNLFGLGKSISAGLKLSTDEQSITLGYGENWMFGQPISNQLSLSYAHSNQTASRLFLSPDGDFAPGYYMQYQQHEFNLSESIGRRWTPDFAILTLRGGISGSLINNVYDADLYTPYDADVSDYGNNWEPRTSISVSFSMDGRDLSYDPANGWFFSQSLAWYGLVPKEVLGWGETEFFLRTDTKAEKYFTLADVPVSDSWKFQLVLMMYSGLSFQFPIENTTIKQANQLYIDGMFYGRGWSLYNDKDGRGRGRALWNNSVELRWPVVPGILAIDAFFDASMIKNEPGQVFSDFGNSKDWYFSYGPSIRFCLQQIPLRFLFVSKFQVGDNGVIFCDKYGNSVDSWLKSWDFVLSFNLTNR